MAKRAAMLASSVWTCWRRLLLAALVVSSLIIGFSAPMQYLPNSENSLRVFVALCCALLLRAPCC